MSLGRAWAHRLPHKLAVAAESGIQGIELFYEDLETHAREQHGGAEPSALMAAAQDIRELCITHNLTIICLQPFMHCGGLRNRAQQEKKLETLRLWFQIAHLLGTDLIQLPSNFLPASELDPSMDLLVRDLTEVADLGACQTPPLRFAYESLCWGTFVDTWEQSWDVVQRVDRSNFGLCLDTFNIAGRVYADPAARSGKTPNADTELAASLRRLRANVDTSRIFFIQVVDAERLAEPLVEGHQYYAADQPTRMSWSRNCRLFYGEEDRGGYLPVKEVARAILDPRDGLGYSGWVSMELFSRTMDDPAAEVPEDHARRSMRSWVKLREDMNMGCAVSKDLMRRLATARDGCPADCGRNKSAVDNADLVPLLTV